LVALVLAQFAAGLHAIKHLGQRSDAASNAPHVLLCLDCAAFAPLAAAHGGDAASLFSAFVGADVVPVQRDVAAVVHRFHVRFQARAPPR
jgi:hypothetical protein